MQSHKLAIKLFTQPGTLPDIDSVVPIFHKWIQNHAIENHMLIDVADYKHVHDGPGVVLVSHEANINTDLTAGRPGLLYFRKQPFSSNELAEKIRQTLVASLKTAELLERDTTARFDTSEILFRIHDRLHAPNTAETFAAVKPALQEIFTRAFNGPVTLDYKPSSQTLFEVTIKSTVRTSINEITNRLAAATV